ncbi:alpha/beta hydrolase [Desulfoluna butyratoxydans]|uniref:Serine aminopeptidase s33 n=1 Tax=Desulfoluna butyratoxydans TaxID=231438 RepID=A0A4U8YHD4_9BACT|nr:alpha/beta hydrolase [Desulfoluna butyratoxydans]VFQ42966.1 serine aminopeptidase s33 [Desulfoluna butyratoxydans]
MPSDTVETTIPSSTPGVDLFVAVNRIEAARAVVVIVHGLAEHLGRYDLVTSELNEAGCSVYRFDNQGHGRSGGERGYLDNFQSFIDDADLLVEKAREENPGLPVFMLGHSMGGFITAAYGVKYPGKLKGQVLSGAAVIQLPLFEAFKDVDFEKEPRVKVPNALSELICRDKAVVTAYDEDPLVLKETCQKLLGEVFINGAGWLTDKLPEYAYPCLILHGDDDQIVTPDASRYMADHIASQDKTLKMYPGFFHEILNENGRDEVVADITEWIWARLG